jgi:hypothetical protein
MATQASAESGLQECAQEAVAQRGTGERTSIAPTPNRRAAGRRRRAAQQVARHDGHQGGHGDDRYRVQKQRSRIATRCGEADVAQAGGDRVPSGSLRAPVATTAALQ